MTAYEKDEKSYFIELELICYDLEQFMKKTETAPIRKAWLAEGFRILEELTTMWREKNI